jgi:hypothetical protein
MSNYKVTKKGTKLPIIRLKGKDYLEVKWRLVWFREDHPDHTIRTNIVSIDDKHAIVCATIKNADLTIATAHKREDLKHFADYLEKAETGAIGRVLALCGYGTQFEPELEEGDRIVDAPVQKVVAAPRVASEAKKSDLLRDIKSGINRLTNNYKDVEKAKTIYKEMGVTGWNELKTLPAGELEKLATMVV